VSNYLNSFSKKAYSIGFGTAVGMGGETRDFEHSDQRSRSIEKAKTALFPHYDFKSFHEQENADRGDAAGHRQANDA